MSGLQPRLLPSRLHERAGHFPPRRKLADWVRPQGRAPSGAPTRRCTAASAPGPVQATLTSLPLPSPALPAHGPAPSRAGRRSVDRWGQAARSAGGRLNSGLRAADPPPAPTGPCRTRPRGSEGSPAACTATPLLTLCLDHLLSRAPQLCRPEAAVSMLEGGHSQMCGAGRLQASPATHTKPSGGSRSGLSSSNPLFLRNAPGDNPLRALMVGEVGPGEEG